MTENETIEKTITSSYEAAYYFMHGATISEVHSRTVQDNKIGKKGFKYQWLITMEGIPITAYHDWRDYQAICNVRDFTNARLKLKKKVAEMLKY